jgi:nicotinate-nucleotide adenylyltransferase
MQLPRPKGKRIGLLGGSFNPAHAGHLAISRQALRHLRLDEIWWLVSPQNPLKSKQGMAPLEARLKSAEAVGRDGRITPLALESDLGTRYTIDTLKALQKHFPLVHFVWLMGADNLLEFSRWKSWRGIMEQVPVAVFDRSPYTYRALTSRAAQVFARHRLPESAAATLALRKAPAWMFLHIPRHPASSTALRQSRKAS